MKDRIFLFLTIVLFMGMFYFSLNTFTYRESLLQAANVIVYTFPAFSQFSVVSFNWKFWASMITMSILLVTIYKQINQIIKLNKENINE